MNTTDFAIGGDGSKKKVPSSESSGCEFKMTYDPACGVFLLRENISIVVSAYMARRVISFGATKTGVVTTHEAEFIRPMALALGTRTDCQEVWIACANTLVRCCAAPAVYNTTEKEGEYTSTLVPRQQLIVGAQDVHGIYPYTDNSVLFLSTKCNAICQLPYTRPEETTRVLWKPPFISEVRVEDRCHMNGVCWTRQEDDSTTWQARYATCVSESDAIDGWRDKRDAGGVIIDLNSNQVVVRGLSMPHSPQWHKNQLWVLNSGTGELGVIDFASGGGDGVFVPKLFLPGFLRGLRFVGKYAIVGSSHDRKNDRFSDLELGRRLEKKNTTAMCGVFIVDLTICSIVHKIELTGDVTELYDVLVVPGRRARILSADDACISDMYNLMEATPAVKEEEKIADDESKIKDSHEDENEDEDEEKKKTKQ